MLNFSEPANGLFLLSVHGNTELHAPTLNTVVRILEHRTKTRMLSLTKPGILALIYINLVLDVYF